MNRGFSLVELSIVLVILGLLTGGILAGQSLIRAAELRSVSSEFSRYVAATNAFRDKYFAIPGDMTNATKFWGTDAGGCPGNNTTTTTPGTATCNGDGNGQITSDASTSNEVYRAWQQLANAGLIEGSYTGVANDPTGNILTHSTTTPNVPASRLPNATWSMYYYSSVTSFADTSRFEGEYGNPFIFGSGINGRQPILTPEEAWNVDTKSDDGKPGTGRIKSPKTPAMANATTGCSNIAYTTASSIAATSEYLFTNKAAACALYMVSGL